MKPATETTTEIEIPKRREVRRDGAREVLEVRDVKAPPVVRQDEKTVRRIG